MSQPPLYKPGDTILQGGYVVEATLGSGGFGAVYLVGHAVLPRKFAAKVMRTAAETPADLERLARRVEREAIVLARFEHANVPTLHDLRIEHGRPVLIMEYLVGKDLATVLDRIEKLDVQDALYVGIEIAKPLYIAHQRNIVHRDIKPENIFCMSVEPPEGKAVLRLLDFGAVRLLGQKGRITKEGVVIGTFHYMAPEALRSGGESDARADQYALGVLLWEALAGYHPFDRERVLNHHQIGLRHLEEPVPDIRAVRPSVPARFADAIHKMMAKHPADRFPTMQDVYDELWATLSTLSYEAEKVGRPLKSIFTRKGIILPSPEIAPASRKRRGSTPQPIVDEATTDEMALPEVSVAYWNVQAGAVPAAQPEAPANGASIASKRPVDEAYEARRAAGRMRELGEGEPSPGAREVCERGLLHVSREVRIEAARALSKIGNELSAQAMDRAATVEQDAQMKRLLLDAAKILRFDGTSKGFVSERRPPPPNEPAPVSPVRASAPLDPTPEEIRGFGLLARTAIEAAAREERVRALQALRARAPGTYRRVRLAMMVIELPQDVGLKGKLYEADRLVALTELERWPADAVLVRLAARAVEHSPHLSIRLACAEILAKRGDHRHEDVLAALLNGELEPDLRRTVAAAYSAVRGRPEQRLAEVSPMPNDLPAIGEDAEPNPPAPLANSRIRRQDIAAVGLALGVVLLVLVVFVLVR